MGLLDFTSKVLTEYKADISDHKAKIKQLTGEQKELAKVELAAAEARNKQIDQAKEKLGQYALAVGGAFAAIKVGQAGLNEYIKYSQVAQTTTNETLERLKSAAGGLRTEMDLLTFAAKTNHGAFKLTTDQQELTLKAMRALEKQGADSAKVFDAVTTAVSEAKTDALEPFGISIDVTGTKADKFAAIMKALSGEVTKAGGDLSSQGDEAKKLGVQWDDAMSTIKRAIGSIVVGLAPLISAVSDLAAAVGAVVGKAAQLASYVPGGTSTAVGAGAAAALGGPGGIALYGAYKLAGNLDQTKAIQAIQARSAEQDAINKAVFDRAMGSLNRAPSYRVGRGDALLASQTSIAAGARGDDILEAVKVAKASALGQDQIARDIDRILDSSTRTAKAALDKQKAFNSFVYGLRGVAVGFGPTKRTGGSGGRGYQPGDFSNGISSDGLGFAPGKGEFDTGVGSTAFGYGSAFGGGFGDPNQFALDDMRRAFARDKADQMIGGTFGIGKYGGGLRDLGAAAGKRQSALEGMFGPLSDFNAYAAGFEMLRGAVGSAFQAWLDGSKSIGAAVKGAISAMIGAKAVDMLSESLRHGAYALGSLAFGDVKGAALHGTAAVKFAAGAVGLGLLAKGLGGSSTTAAGASGGAAPTGGSIAGQQSSSRPITILLGDEMAADSPRRRQQRAAYTIEQAKRGLSNEAGVIYG